MFGSNMVKSVALSLKLSLYASKASPTIQTLTHYAPSA